MNTQSFTLRTEIAWADLPSRKEGEKEQEEEKNHSGLSFAGW